MTVGGEPKHLIGKLGMQTGNETSLQSNGELSPQNT